MKGKKFWEEHSACVPQGGLCMDLSASVAQSSGWRNWGSQYIYIVMGEGCKIFFEFLSHTYTCHWSSEVHFNHAAKYGVFQSQIFGRPGASPGFRSTNQKGLKSFHGRTFSP